MAIELILAGNGPGELMGWIRPVAHAARELAAQTGTDLHLTVALLPSQFASGREHAVVREWTLFDTVYDPSACLRLTLGVRRAAPPHRGVLVHLGGDLWMSARLAARLRVPACALSETLLIARRHRAFARVFAVSEPLATALVSRGVPSGKVVVTGDPRTDALGQERGSAPALPPPEVPVAGDAYIVSFLPGSRDRVAEALAPFFLEVAGALRDRLPTTAVQVILSPFLSPAVIRSLRAQATAHWPHLPVAWVEAQPWAALMQSDLVVTIPGTNTMELALAGVPFAVVLPVDHMARASVEGALQWLGRVPGLGAALKRMVLGRYLAKHRYVALPNQRAGRAIVPEWIGRWTPQDLANRVAMLLQDPPARAGITTALRGIYASMPGASRRVAAEALALVGVGVPA